MNEKGEITGEYHNESDNDSSEHTTNSNSVDSKEKNEQNALEGKSTSVWLDDIFGSGNNNGNVIQVMKSLLDDNTAQFTGYINIQDKSSGIGIVKKGSIRIQVHKEEKGEYWLIVADCDMKKNLIVWNTHSSGDKMMRMDLDLNLNLNGNGWEECGVIDLNNTGSYWEGGVLNGRERYCCGYGKEYNEENNLVYEGFMFGDKRVCYGNEYRGIRDKNVLMYEGGYCNGDRYGFGKSYDLNGEIEYEGEGIDNQSIHEVHKKLTLKNGDSLLLPLWIEELMIETKLFNDRGISSINFSSVFNRLRRIEIGNDCFEKVREFVLDGLEKLESVKIGEECFRMSDEERDDGVCRITNCPNLTQLEIGNWSFRDFKQFELSKVNSLQSIQFGDFCFVCVENCILKGE